MNIIYKLVMFIIIIEATSSDQSNMIILNDPVAVLGVPSSNVYLSNPVDYTSTKYDTIYVLDQRNIEVTAFNMSGSALFTIGKWGQGPGEFIKPTSIASTDSTLFIADEEMKRISVFTLTGQYMYSIQLLGTPGKMIPYNSSLYVGIRSTNNIVVKININSPKEQKIILSYELPELEDTEIRQRLSFPELTIINKMLYVGLANKNIIYVLSCENDGVIQKYNITNTYIESYMRRCKVRNRELNEGTWIVPKSFHGLSQLKEKYLLIQVRTAHIENALPTLIIIDSNTGRVSDTIISSINPGYQHPKILNNGMLAWTSYNESLVYIYSIDNYINTIR